MRTMFWVALAVIVTFSFAVAPSATVQLMNDMTHTVSIDAQDVYGHIAITFQNWESK